MIDSQVKQGESYDVSEVKTHIGHYLNSLELESTLTGLELIKVMITAHLSRYSFSSVNVILNKALPLDEEVLFERVINQKSGGYCFEHNKIFYLALSALGFEVRPLIARVMFSGDPDTGRLHRLTLLSFENEQYIIDVGFGVLTPATVIKISTQSDQREQYQVEQGINNCFIIKEVEGANSTTLYRVDLAEYTEFDCDISHFYSHQSPQAMFVNHLVVSRLKNNTKYLLEAMFHNAVVPHMQQPIFAAYLALRYFL